MPRTFSFHERARIIASMHKIGIDLIRKKGVKQITIEDITNGVNIAKGSFYSFYKSREELLWDIIKRQEQIIIENTKDILAEDIDKKEKVRKILYDVYLKEDNLVFYLSQADLEYITRKLSPEVMQKDKEAGDNIYELVLSHFGFRVNSDNIEVLASLVSNVQYASGTSIPQSDEVRKRVLEILVEAIADYLAGGKL